MFTLMLVQINEFCSLSDGGKGSLRDSMWRADKGEYRAIVIIVCVLVKQRNPGYLTNYPADSGNNFGPTAFRKIGNTFNEFFSHGCLLDV
jgi:hypothetical protein